MKEISNCRSTDKYGVARQQDFELGKVWIFSLDFVLLF